jgi:UDP-N-acetylglucosamine--N-acetylmuramyl-(pentapeptide) pyrophosphoryl-undecaprenol N-acetylglucosamine transferase
VFGFGGYATLVPGIVARARKIPVVLYEQNRVMGLTNRLLAPIADRVNLHWLPGAGSLRKNMAVTGNPVRASVRRIARDEAAERLGLDAARPTIAILGGSQGATGLNNRILDALPSLGANASTANRVQVIHQTGADSFSRVRGAYAAAGLDAVVSPFFNDVSAIYSLADLVIARAGATTIAELAAVKARSLLVPYPHASENHQYHNAKAHVAAHGGGVVPQDLLVPSLVASVFAAVCGEVPVVETIDAELAAAGRRAARQESDRIALLSARLAARSTRQGRTREAAHV